MNSEIKFIYNLISNKQNIVNIYRQVVFKYQVVSNFLITCQTQVKFLSVKIKSRQVVVYQVKPILRHFKYFSKSSRTLLDESLDVYS